MLKEQKELDYIALNALLNIVDENNQIQFDKDKEAAKQYFLQHVNQNMVWFHNLEEKIDYLVTNEYYDKSLIDLYEFKFIKSLFKRAYGFKFRFSTFMGAYKYYNQYNLKTFDGTKYLERFEDRVTMCALTLANGNEEDAIGYLDEMMSGRLQPATPTFLNCGKAQRGELSSCYLQHVSDNLESISNSINSALQLSKRGGGVAFCLTDIRETGSPIKNTKGVSSGVVPIMKIYEDSFSYANQLGQRSGSGAIYISAHHPDIMKVLDTKRENADEKIRIKTLSIGVIIPDITFELAKNNEYMYLFSPYDILREYGKPMSEISITEMYKELVDNKNITKKKISARVFFQTLAELQFESGYPYIMFEDTVNRLNPIHGKIKMSNLCTEILQVQEPSEFNPDGTYRVVGKDISCNLASLNVAKAMESPNFGLTVERAIKALTSVSDQSNIECVTSIDRGNKLSHAVGLGQMNLHGFFGKEHMHYGSPESLEFTDLYFMTVTYHALRTSNELAKERKQTFYQFEKSKYATGEYFDFYLDNEWIAKHPKVIEIFDKYQFKLPTREDWLQLKQNVMEYGLYNQNLQAIAPTGSISYVNHSTSSVHPIVSMIEIRKESKVGRVYYPAAYLDNNNKEYYQNAYEIGYEKIIDIYSVITKHVDQGSSLTLFFKDTATTRDVNKAQIYAWKKGIKTIYYVRIKQDALEGTEVETCVSCSI